MKGPFLGSLALVVALVCAADTLAARPLSAPQTIAVTVHAPATAVFDTAFSVSADSSSRLAVAYSSAGSCTNVGATFTMTGGTGVCQVRYDQPGGPGFAPAAQVLESVTAQKAGQRITFQALPDLTWGAPDIAVVALATSDLPTTLTANGSCTISGAIAHLTGAGSCTITATQPGDANYTAAPATSDTFAIAKATQKITLAVPRGGVYVARPPFKVTVRASATSGLAVSLAVNGPCRVAGPVVRFTAKGRCTVTASQQGNANFAAAPRVSRTLRLTLPRR